MYCILYLEEEDNTHKKNLDKQYSLFFWVFFKEKKTKMILYYYKKKTPKEPNLLNLLSRLL